jgi:hypothetical protein
MSALGQKQTFAPQKIVSALPLKADIGRTRCSTTAKSVTQATSNPSPAAFSEIREFFKLQAEIFSPLLL